MSKPQITVRIPPSLLTQLNSYLERTGTSKTEVVVGAIARYIGYELDMPLAHRVAEVERRMVALETLVNNIS